MFLKQTEYFYRSKLTVIDFQANWGSIFSIINQHRIENQTEWCHTYTKVTKLKQVKQGCHYISSITFLKDLGDFWINWDRVLDVLKLG